ncbi:MAG: SRPBCC domain-containing protein [Candidatus Dormibacteraeota bacterium]|nr:SRPBCC domain-containing protein [Candidatus Dormibacteraeota bacterium]
MSQAGPEIRHSVFIRAPREKVWTAFTTPQGLDGWWGTRGSEIDLRPGGKLTLRWRGWGAEQDINADRDCVVLEVIPPTRFVFRWGETADAMTTVEFDLEERAGGTLLRLREHGFAPTAKGRQSFEGNSLGWGEAAILIKFYVEHGVSY